MVEAADFRKCDHITVGDGLHAARRRRVFRQREVGPCLVIVGDISAERVPQMRLVEDDDVIETLAANGADQALDVGFCQGLDGAERTSRMPIVATRRRNGSP